jgi:hypothetical protein
MSEEVRPTLPLDEREEALWMLQRMFPEDGIPNIGLAVYLSGRTDPEILRRAALSVLQRHAMLRSLVRIQDGRACRIVLESTFGCRRKPAWTPTCGTWRDGHSTWRTTS